MEYVSARKTVRTFPVSGVNADNVELGAIIIPAGRKATIWSLYAAIDDVSGNAATAELVDTDGTTVLAEVSIDGTNDTPAASAATFPINIDASASLQQLRVRLNSASGTDSGTLAWIEVEITA